MNHIRFDASVMTMPIKTRAELIAKSYKTLPTWKWRKD